MKLRLAIMALVLVAVAQAAPAPTIKPKPRDEAAPTIKPKPRPESAEARKGYTHVLLRPGQKVRSIEPKEAMMQAMAVQKDRKFDISAAQQRQLEQVVGRIKENPQDMNGIRRGWARFIKSLKNHSKPVDLSALMDHTIRTSMLEANCDLRFFAARAERLRSDVAGTKRLLAELRALKRKMRGNPAAFQEVTAEMLDAETTKWQGKLTMIRADAQLANVDLQNSMQKQQQTVQMMSNIMKMMNDQAMAAIRNVR